MLKHFSKLLIFSLCTCAATTAQAAVVSSDSAKQLAADFFAASDNDRLASADALELVYTSGTTARPLYYVFNARDSKGYIIISADDCTTPVLAYSLENSYDTTAVPQAMKWLLSGLEDEIKAAPKLQKPVEHARRRQMARRAGSATTQRIELETPQWSQEAPFNNAIPGRPLAGCVGTAMAIIMKYHNYPERGTGSYNSVSFDVAYDWENMMMHNYRNGYTEEQADAVATLVYHAAASVGTQFGYSGSSAYEARVPAALVNYFGYDPGVSFKKRSETANQAQFDQIVANEIEAGRPVLYCGQDVTVGHAFVVDGFDPANNMIRINWGWGGAAGNNNGAWYASTALNPTVSQTHSFNNLTTIIYNIKPGNGNNTSWSPIHLTADGGQPGMGSDMTELAPGKTFTVRAGNLKNLSYTKFSGKIAVALFSDSGTFKTLLSAPQGLNLDGMTYLFNSFTDFRNCSLPAGIAVAEGDMVRLATSADDGATWLPVAGELLTINEIPASRTTPDYFAVKFPASVAGVTLSGDNKVIRGWNYSFSATPADPAQDVVTVKANGILLQPAANTYNYSIGNVKEDQNITVLVQKASEVKEKRSIWVEEAGQLYSLIPESEHASIKDLTLFGTIDARDFDFMRNNMNLSRLDISAVYIAANGANPANAIPRSAFQGKSNLKTVLLPNNITCLKNSAFRQCGITEISIPASVSTYEYNVFLGCSALRDIWVARNKVEFINWCVLNGCNYSALTLHAPNEGLINQYKAHENWGKIKNYEVGTKPVQNDCAFAVSENDLVKFDSEALTGRVEKGTRVSFTAEYIANNDNRMEVYANATKLIPEAGGKYNLTVNNNTIIHFDIIEPAKPSGYDSFWQLTNTGGTVGLITDAVNVIPGSDFTIRANALYVPDEYSSMFWAAVLTDADNNIKEFISPVSNWNGMSGDGLKMNINCRVNESTVREGNLIRLATSFNKKTWDLVKGRTPDVIDALPAINNQTPVYNINIPELPDANVTGAVATAVRGRDINLRITPKVSSHTIDVVLNGDTILTKGKTFNYSFIAKQDMDFDVKIIPPVTYTEATVVLKEGEHFYLSGYEGIDNWGSLNYEMAQKYRNITKLKIVGKVDFYDFNFFRENYWIAANIRLLDLSEAQFVRDRTNQSGGLDNVFPARALFNPQLGGCHVEEIILPSTLTQFDSDAFKGCSRLKEIRLPENLRYWKRGKLVSAGIVKDLTRGGLLDDVFLGCNSLETIYLPCAPGPNGNIGHWYYSQYHALRSGFPDNKKVTVVVPEEHLNAYRTPRVDTGDNEENWSNGWAAGGFNIVSEYPVYSLGFDASRCFVTDAEIKDNVSRAAVFLKDNINRESLERKLYIGAKSTITDGRPAGIDTFNADCKVKVYDNGKLMADDAVAQDGSVTLTYWNPNKHADKSGNHDIKVKYLYDVTFHCSSDMFMVEPENIRNNQETLGDEATEFETWNYFNPTAPVLENVAENSTVRFTLRLTPKTRSRVGGIEARVKVGDHQIEPDEEGWFSIDVTDAAPTVEIFAVPVNGATLNTEEINSINTEEAVDITDIALEGEISPETLATVVDNFGALENLDLSGMETPVPAGAFENKESLTTVTLPEIETIEPNTFKGCTNLATVTVPESVSTIGDGAFSGCSSLESITLTGVDAIGADAFNGCDNLTSINLNASTPNTQARANRVQRAATFDNKAFNGLNPNCLIIIDEGMTVPQAPANYIATTTGIITDTNADGETFQREGRIYEAASDIALCPGYPFAVTNQFTVKGGNAISLTCDLTSSSRGDWTSLLLPFTPDKATGASGNELTLTVNETDIADGGNYMAGSINPETGALELQDAITANTPYIVSLPSTTPTQQVRFSANEATVAPTPEEISVEGTLYTLDASYATMQVPAETTYELNPEGSAFVITATAEDDAETASTVTVAPFSVYAVSNSGNQRFDIVLKNGDTDGIDAINTGNSHLSFRREGSNLVIYSDKVIETTVHAINGSLAAKISLREGRNVLTGLPAGIYIIAGTKVAL